MVVNNLLNIANIHYKVVSVQNVQCRMILFKTALKFSKKINVRTGYNL